MPEAFSSSTTSPGPGVGSGKFRISTRRLPRKSAPRMRRMMPSKRPALPRPPDCDRHPGAGGVAALKVDEQDLAVLAEARAGELAVAEDIDRELEWLALRAKADQPVNALQSGRERMRVLGRAADCVVLAEHDAAVGADAEVVGRLERLVGRRLEHQHELILLLVAFVAGHVVPELAEAIAVGALHGAAAGRHEIDRAPVLAAEHALEAVER